jgi:hypothetical protein
VTVAATAELTRRGVVQPYLSRAVSAAPPPFDGLLMLLESHLCLVLALLLGWTGSSLLVALRGILRWQNTGETSMAATMTAGALATLKAAPGGGLVMEKMIQGVRAKVEASRKAMEAQRGDKLLDTMPERGLPHKKVLAELEKLARPDHDKVGGGKLFGFVYQDPANKAHYNLLHKAYELFSETNPLSPGLLLLV